MGEWRWWRVAVASLVYVGAALGVTCWRLTVEAQRALRRAGVPTGDLYVIFPRRRAWWVAMVVLPPAALVAAHVWRRRRS
jgi:hypothetical protein